MTRPPQMPPLQPPEPLDASERSLARALRSLPSGTPPPELDARILGAARRSVHMQPPRRRDRRWIIGLSTAATAVLAMGILLKMHGLGRDAVLAPPAETESTTVVVPANAPVTPVPLQKSPESSMAADTAAPAVGAASGIAPATPAQPPQETSGRLHEEQSASSDAVAAKQAPRAFPAGVAPKPSAPPVILNTPAPMAAPAPPPPPAAERKDSDATESGYTRRDAAALSAPAPAAAAGGMLGPTAQDQAQASKSASNALQATEPVPQRGEMDKATAVGSRMKAASPALPALSDDATLGPAEWIERVRDRLRHGDRAGATSSLHAFVHAHPDATIPDDLQPLLR
jgi:hypothetical protein